MNKSNFISILMHSAMHIWNHMQFDKAIVSDYPFAWGGNSSNTSNAFLLLYYNEWYMPKPGLRTGSVKRGCIEGTNKSTFTFIFTKAKFHFYEALLNGFSKKRISLVCSVCFQTAGKGDGIAHAKTKSLQDINSALSLTVSITLG